APSAPALAAGAGIARCEPILTAGPAGRQRGHTVVATIAMAASAPATSRLRHALRAAEIAAATWTGILVAEVPAQRRAPAARLLGVFGDGAEPARVLAPEDLEPAAQALDTLHQRVEWPGRVHATRVDAFADAGLDQRRHQRAGRPLRDAGGERQLL